MNNTEKGVVILSKLQMIFNKLSIVATILFTVVVIWGLWNAYDSYKLNKKHEELIKLEYKAYEEYLSILDSLNQIRNTNKELTDLFYEELDYILKINSTLKEKSLEKEVNK